MTDWTRWTLWPANMFQKRWGWLVARGRTCCKQPLLNWSNNFGWLEGCVLCVVLRCAFNLVWVGYWVHLQWATPVGPDQKCQLQSNTEKKSTEDWRRPILAPSTVFDFLQTETIPLKNVSSFPACTDDWWQFVIRKRALVVATTLIPPFQRNCAVAMSPSEKERPGSIPPWCPSPAAQPWATLCSNVLLLPLDESCHHVPHKATQGFVVWRLQGLPGMEGRYKLPPSQLQRLQGQCPPTSPHTSTNRNVVLLWFPMPLLRKTRPILAPMSGTNVPPTKLLKRPCWIHLARLHVASEWEDAESLKQRSTCQRRDSANETAECTLP